LHLGWSDILNEVLFFLVQGFRDSGLSQTFLGVETVLETQVTLRNFTSIDVDCSLRYWLLVDGNKQKLAEGGQVAIEIEGRNAIRIFSGQQVELL
jgi:hypothetical protein